MKTEERARLNYLLYRMSVLQRRKFVLNKRLVRTMNQIRELSQEISELQRTCEPTVVAEPRTERRRRSRSGNPKEELKRLVNSMNLSAEQVAALKELGVI